MNTITSHQTEQARRPRVVIVGAGFGGLRAASKLRGKPVDVVLIDRQNFHTFLPLLYEVAAAGLAPDDIAQPVRAIVRGADNVRFRMADVQRIDLDEKLVMADGGPLPYDELIIAAGSTTNFFGLPHAEERALGLKDIREATAVRNRILRSFERATTVANESERDALMTIIVIGGGPTGVEMAGALAELKRHVLPHDYPDLDVSRSRVILLEATDHLLPALPPRLRRRAAEQLRSLGVEVRFGSNVVEIVEGGVRLASGETIASASVLWVAGVRGEPLGEHMQAEVDGSGRVKVRPTLQIPGHDQACVVGDLASLEGPGGRPHPMVAPVAIQQGELAAANILRRIEGQPLKTFRYKDRGVMATIGRRKAVAQIFGLQLSGFVAWSVWLTAHLMAIVDLRNRSRVLMSWIWNYLRYDRANRLVTDTTPSPKQPDPVDSEAREARA